MGYESTIPQKQQLQQMGHQWTHWCGQVDTDGDQSHVYIFFFHFILFPTDVIESLIVGILFSCQVTVKLNI